MGPVDALVRTVFEVTAVLQLVAASHGLWLTQMLRMSVPANHLGLERLTLSGVGEPGRGAGTARAGSRTADGRVVEVTLSATGRRLARRIDREVEAALTLPIASLPGGEAHHMQTLLKRFLASGRQL